jgi:hypothetical protein
VAAVHAAAQRKRVAPPPDAAVRAVFQAQMEAAKEVQWAANRDPDFTPGEPIPDLDAELRPALLRIGERVAAHLLTLPADLDPDEVQRAARDGLRSPWLSERSRRAIADAIAGLTATSGGSGGPPPDPRPSG